ncbi:DUF1932 domain-containing protein [Glycomyces xiaoerkulensis]|uniref:DUF1932 domain-containing protein n=1 Tax=Glycomyces xiaoerkulensis TaxID=2038139 RepID=UPI0018E48668|nr:DUF1932 domain-containing protein [Glycomyces xiaoerkulensis]
MIGILHPGRMGAAVAAQARRRGARVLWRPAGRSEATVQRAQASGPDSTRTLPELLDRVSLVLSVCPPAFAEDLAREVAQLFTGTLVEARQIGPEVGEASALKLSFASFQKASRALAAVSHALADRHGVREELRSEADRMGPSALAQPGYLPSLAARAWRWAPEMHEIAAALREAGLPEDLAAGAERVFERWSGDKDDWDIDLHEVFEHLGSTADDQGV